MKRYRIVLLVLVFVAFAGFVVLRRSQVSAQTVNVKVTPTNVSRVVLAKINPGQRPAFDQDVMSNLIPVFEEEKKAGIITGYEFFNNVTADSPNDWNVGMLLTYANYAALDGLGETSRSHRTETLRLSREAASSGRTPQPNTQVVSNRLIRMVNYSQATPVS